MRLYATLCKELQALTADFLLDSIGLADTVIFDFLVNKVSNEDRINRLLGECLDENGKALAKRRKTTRTMVFDIEKYA